MEKSKGEKPKKEKAIKLGFFQRLKISVIDFDQYHIVAAEGIKKSLVYLLKLLLIFTIVATFAAIIKMNEEYKEIIDNFIALYGEVLAYAMVFITAFLTYFVTVTIDILALSMVGFVLSRIIRLPLKFSAVYAMAVSSITLPVFLNIAYIIANVTTGFTMEYFQVMYTLIAYIYMIAALLLMRSNLLKTKFNITTTIHKNNSGKLDEEE